MKTFKYFSTFTGIGGFELGIGKEHECVGYSEIDRYAVQIYQQHYPHHKNYGDITKIKTKDLPDFELLVGGFPCQSFSIAGKRGGFADTRGTLFFEIARILKDKSPRLFLLENVKGLLSHDAGETFRTIISTLDELGYDLQWQVLNSKNHGVPQNRERVYIVGHLRGTPRPEVFPIESDNGETSNEVTAKGQLVDLTRREPTSYRERTDGRAGTLDANYYNGLANQERPGVKINVVGMLNDETWKKRNESIRRVYGTDGIAPTIPTGTGGGVMPKIVAQRGRYNADGKTEQQLEPRPDDISNTLTAVQKDNMVLDDVRIRRLTPIECERLQGFPDVEKRSIIEVCKQVNASGAKTILNIRDIDQDSAVQADVLIDCEESGVEILSHGKLLFYAKNAEKKNWSRLHIKTDDFVQMLVGINTTKEKIIRRGEEELHQRGQCSTHKQNGVKLEKLSGSEITLPVGDAESDSTTPKELLRCITSDHSDIKSLEQKLQTLSSYVTHVTTGFIPEKIQNQNTYTIEVRTRVGWTYSVSDTQRYKCCGNAVTVNVVRDIIKAMLCNTNE